MPIIPMATHMLPATMSIFRLYSLTMPGYFNDLLHIMPWILVQAIIIFYLLSNNSMLLKLQTS